MAKAKRVEVGEFDAGKAKSILDEMVANKDAYKPKTLQDEFRPLMPQIQALTEHGVPMGSIIKKLADGGQKVSESQLRKFLSDWRAENGIVEAKKAGKTEKAPAAAAAVPPAKPNGAGQAAQK
ncbi:hypothetical protein [Cupriavidus metallidurans]|uniref:hypothetical protein n=1 Tax=Cupriavidus metallidurans TaxID=119219 RepID=UPI00078839C3|nr:hypothetical protein [Cupriavidus metallidurans]AVA36291.1 hypothetical protein C3Z06_23545 [Cupriavidus metallidurans]AVA36612.1 hypothetical protein C3Z06_25345 [Cupriavidus metallidurans]